jgi:hypothetical protein
LNEAEGAVALMRQPMSRENFPKVERPPPDGRLPKYKLMSSAPSLEELIDEEFFVLAWPPKF